MNIFVAIYVAVALFVLYNAMYKVSIAGGPRAIIGEKNDFGKITIPLFWTLVVIFAIIWPVSFILSYWKAAKKNLG